MSFADNTTGGRVILEGKIPFKITLTDTCEVGDLVGYDALSSGAWERQDVANKVFAVCVAGQKAVSGDEITVYKEAVIDLGSGCTATAGDLIYSGSTAGRYAAEPEGSWQQAVAMMTTAQIMYVRPMAMPLTVYTLTGVGHAGYFRCEVDADEETPEGHFGGIRIDVKTIASTASITSEARCLFCFMQLQEVCGIGSNASTFIRLEDGCASSCGVDSYINFVGGTGGDPPDYLFQFSTLTPTNSAWEIAANQPTGSGGYIKLDFGGTTRYLALYTTSTGG